MVLTPKLDIRQKQSATITPFLQQAIKILQMSQQELAATVNDELAKNPLLSKEYDEHEALDSESDQPKEAAAEMDAASGLEQTGVDDSALDANYENLYEGDLVWHNKGRQQDFSSSGDFSALDTLSSSRSLIADLERQIGLTFKTNTDRLLAGALLNYLDENGWLGEQHLELCTNLNCSQAQLKQVISKLQQFEPVGIFARNLAECLRLQLQHHGELTATLEILLQHLVLVAEQKWSELTKLCSCSMDDLRVMVRRIRACNPRPSSEYEQTITQTVIPDLYLRRTRQGEWQLEVNQEVVPNVVLNKDYYHELRQAKLKNEDRQYLSSNWQSANWLIKAISQRGVTLQRVAASIVKRQDGFFQQGVAALRPMILRDVADDVGMHESTVSRLTNGKYISCSQGVFELKYFFSAKLGGLFGTSHSSASVKHLIKLMIEKETREKPKSDDVLVAELEAQGVTIARRTVAKYRELLGIASSAKRRRQGITTL